MSKRILSAMLAVALVAAGGAPAAIAQPPAQQHATTPSQAQLRDAIARLTSLSPKEIRVHVTSAMIRVELVNTGYNEDPPSGREYLASTIAALVNANTEKDARLKPIVVLHVEFVKKGRWSTKVIDTVEFRKGADGAFAGHRT
jgi:hypothetical protein